MQSLRQRNFLGGVLDRWNVVRNPTMRPLSRLGSVRLIGALLLFASSGLAQGLINTVAGSTWTFPAGSISPATSAPLGTIQGVAVDSSGNVYATDFGNRTVVKITVSSNTLTVVAGNGTFGYSGDGGPATSASLSLAFGVAVDSLGNVFIADTLNQRVRKVTVSTGVITTVAGNGVAGFSGDSGLATSASLNNPTGVAVDASGNLYIADRDNHRIRKVTAGTITTVAGNGTGAFSGDGTATSISLNQPSGVAVSGTVVFIADTLNNRIRKLTNGAIATVAGDGTAGFSGDGAGATSAALANPTGVAVDAFGNFYIADSSNRIRKVTGTTISTVAGSGSFSFSGDDGAATSAALASPFSVAADGSGNVFIADSANSRVRKVAGTTITTFAGNGSFKYGGDSGSALSASMSSPTSVAMDASGNLFIADSANNRIRKVTVSTGVITTFAGTGQYGFGGDAGPAASALLNVPTGVAVDRGSTGLYVADVFNHRIRKVDFTTGIITTVVGDGFGRFSGDGLGPLGSSLNQPSAVTFDALGNLYIADTKNQRIRKVSGGVITTVAGTGTGAYSGDRIAASSATLNNPTAVAVDSAFNIYIADRDNQRVRKVTAATGLITTVAGNGTPGYSGDGGAATSALLNFPSGVAVDSAGNISIADRNNHVIRKVTVATGTINTIAGSGSFGLAGDGGLAAFSSLGAPEGVLVDASGSLVIADTANDRVRKVFAGLVTAGAVQGAPGAAVNIPVTLGLFGSATVDSLAFGLRVIPNGPAPVLTGPLSFAATSPMPAPNGPVSAGANSVGVSWLNQASAPFPLSAALQLGVVRVTIPANAQSGQTYAIQITGASGSLTGTPVSLLPGPNSTLAVALGSYAAGDSFPPGLDFNSNGTTNDAGEFGDNQLTVLDLIDALRAVTRVAGFRPPCPSDRYDAIDTSPADTGTTRGGDGILDVLDLIVTLNRVTNVDPSRPRRAPGGAPACPVGANAAPGLQALASARGSATSGILDFGEAEPVGGRLRVPVYLRVRENLTLAGLSFALGVTGPSSQLRFAPVQDRVPTLVDDGLPGTLALAWLDGFSLAAGDRVLLGFVEVPGLGADQNVSALLRVYGVIANAQRDGRRIRLASPETVPVRSGRRLR